MSVATKALTSAGIVGAGDVACQTLFEGRSLRGSSSLDEPEQANVGAADGATARPLAFDNVRLGNMTLLGAVLVAPVLHVWYGFLGRRIPGTSLGPVAGRVLLDQAIFAPSFIAVFFAALAVSLIPHASDSRPFQTVFLRCWRACVCGACGVQESNWTHGALTCWRMLQGLEGKSVRQLEEQLRDSWSETVVTNWKLWVPCQIINLGFVPGHLQVLVSNIVALAWNSYVSYITHRPALADGLNIEK